MPQDKLGKYCPGRKLVVRFDRKPGDVPLLSINSDDLSGHGVDVNVKEVSSMLLQHSSCIKFPLWYTVATNSAVNH